MKTPKKFKRFDVNRNGDLSPEEIMQANELLELELREEKADTQRRMAWVAMLSMLIFTICLFLPIIPDTRVQALADLLGLFYIAQAGVVGAYMGVTAWMSRSDNSSYSRSYTAYERPIEYRRDLEDGNP
jgi:hypothetical protein